VLFIRWLSTGAGVAFTSQKFASAQFLPWNWYSIKGKHKYNKLSNTQKLYCMSMLQDYIFLVFEIYKGMVKRKLPP